MNHFFGQLAGESYRNVDGSDRQAIIQKCEVGELLVLEHEPDNPHDINAIRVLRGTGEQIGYLPRDFAGQVVSRTAKGDIFHAAISGIGRVHGLGPYGVALLIVVDNGDADRMMIAEYVHRVLADDLRPRRVGAADDRAAFESAAATEDRSQIWVWGAVGIALAFAAVLLLRAVLG